MGKKITVSCIGFGQRGQAYLREMSKLPDKYEVVSVCDIDSFRANKCKEMYNLSESNVFFDEDEFFKEKRSDLLVVATQDQDHVRQAVKGLNVGYDLLLEKPISKDRNELFELLKTQKKTGHKVLVCHVLRYAPAFTKAKELIDEGRIGKTIMIDLTENVCFSHQVHSYVRGNWRRSEETSPMILAKCCHDLDLLSWFIGDKCESIYSLGELNYFKKENQPEGALDRCKGCKYQGKCPYDAYDLYINKNFWGRDFITDVRPLTKEALTEALDKGPYGRCVFACDNDVVDNQTVTMHFVNGVDANLKMTAFTSRGGRTLRIYGTKGEIDLDERLGTIEIGEFNGKRESIKISTMVDAASGHGGGDAGIVKSLYEYLVSGNDKYVTSLDASIQSHLMGIEAENSRLDKGKKIYIDYQE